MLRRLQSNTILTIALLLLVGFNVGYFLPRFPNESQNLFNLIPKALALATPSNYLSFQGQLTDQTGAPITSTKSMAFSLYDASGGGNLIYNETQSIMPDSRGIFYAEIGSGTVGSPAGSQPWPPTFGIPYWLAVRIGASGAYLSPRIALTASPYQNGINQTPATSFVSNTKTCTDTTLTTTLMAGFKSNYTTSTYSSGGIFVVLTFNVASPNTGGINSKWQIAHGTGNAPACNGGATGTIEGQQYTINTEAAIAGGYSQSVGVVITGLSVNTAYWFDVQVSDSSTASWIYSKPSISVTDMPQTALNTAPSVTFNTNNNAPCGRNTGANAMAGLAATYTTGAAGSFAGSVYVQLTFDIQSPATITLTSAWQLAYGTGGAPACNAAATGTPIGQSYTVETETATLLETSQTVGVVISGLTASTAYWFDVQATDSTTGVWNYAKPDLAVMQITTKANLSPDLTLQTNTNTCTRNTAANAMGGLQLLYTTASPTNGKVFATLTFAVQTPAVTTINSIWQVSYAAVSTTAIPACGGAAVGTTVGNTFTINTVAGGTTPLRLGQSEGFVLTGLSGNTQYWFDIQATDSTTDSWIFSNPTLSVSEPLSTTVTSCLNIANAICNIAPSTQIDNFGTPTTGFILQTAFGATQAPFSIQNSVGTSLWTIDTTGTLTVGSVPWARLTSFPSGCAANTFITTLATTPTCSGAASWANIVSFPAACAANTFITTLATTPTCSGAASWANLVSFPSACSAMQYVSQIAVTPTCSQPVPDVRATSSPTSTTATFVSTTLTFSTATNTNYIFAADLSATTATGSSLNFAIATLAAGAALVRVEAYCVSGTASLFSGVQTNTATAIMSSAATTTPDLCHVSGVITVGGTATTIQINFNDPAAAGTTTIQSGSWMTVEAVA